MLTKCHVCMLRPELRSYVESGVVGDYDVDDDGGGGGG